MKIPKKILSVISLLLIYNSSVFADRIVGPAPGDYSKDFKFGELDCTRKHISGKTSGEHESSLDCYNKEKKLVFSVPDIRSNYSTSAPLPFISPSGKYLAGLSNFGLDPYRIYVLDQEGKMLLQKDFSSFDFKKYCVLSKTVKRVWYDSECQDPIHFVEERGRLKTVKVRACRRDDDLQLAGKPCGGKWLKVSLPQ